jgi:hypothetical protein
VKGYVTWSSGVKMIRFENSGRGTLNGHKSIKVVLRCDLRSDLLKTQGLLEKLNGKVHSYI